MAEKKPLSWFITALILLGLLFIVFLFMGKVFGIEIPISFLKSEEPNYVQAEEYFNEYMENLEECSKVDDYNCICGEMENFPATLPDKYYITFENGGGNKKNISLYYDYRGKEDRIITSVELEKTNFFVIPMTLVDEDKNDNIYDLLTIQNFDDKFKESMTLGLGSFESDKFKEIKELYWEYNKNFLPQYPYFIYEITDSKGDSLKRGDFVNKHIFDYYGADLKKPIISPFVLKEGDNLYYVSYGLHRFLQPILIPIGKIEWTNYYNLLRGTNLKRLDKIYGAPIIKEENSETYVVHLKVLQRAISKLPKCEDGRQKAIDEFLRIKGKFVIWDLTTLGLVPLKETEEIKVELPQGYFIEADKTGISLMNRVDGKKKVKVYYGYEDCPSQTLNLGMKDPKFTKTDSWVEKAKYTPKFIRIEEARLKGNFLCEGQKEFDILNGWTIYIKNGCLSLEE